MTDLIERLRAGTGGGKHWMDLHTESADTIEAQAERIRVLREALQDALDRMDRARNILTDGKPRPECNWGMLATEQLRPILEATND